MNIHAEVCLLDYGGGCEITPTKLKECCKVAETCVKGLCQMLEQSLKEADEKAQQERLERLQQQQHNSSVGTTSLPPPPNTPYFEQSDNTNMEIEVDNVDTDQISDSQTKAEEAWRRQALDYSQGHVASKVREDNDGKDRPSAQKKAASLLASMLKSVSQMDVSADSVEYDNQMVPEKADANGNADLSKETKESTANDREGTTKGVMTMDTDDDEEEAPTVLQSEFQSVPSSSEPKPERKEIPTETEDVDLSMAIKKKKKKAKKKK